jgi:hypothetical protein
VTATQELSAIELVIQSMSPDMTRLFHSHVLPHPCIASQKLVGAALVGGIGVCDDTLWIPMFPTSFIVQILPNSSKGTSTLDWDQQFGQFT